MLRKLGGAGFFVAVSGGRNSVIFWESLLKNEHEGVWRSEERDGKGKKRAVEIQENGWPNLKEENISRQMTFNLLT